MWPNKNYFRPVAAASTTLAVLLFTSLTIQAAPEPANANLVPVSVMSVQHQPYAKPVIASGVVRPVSEQTLAFKVAGFVDKVLVKEGQFVKKGQPLALLVLDEIDARVAKATAVLDDAQRQLERITTLKGRQLASDERGRQAQTSVQIAQADLKIAQFNRKYAVIHAPAQGRILTRHIEANELVQSGQTAFVFADENQGWSVRLSVADVDVVQLQLGDKAQVQLDAYAGQFFSGKIREIAGRSDATSQTFEVDVLLEKAPRLYSGLIAHTRITPSHKTSLVAIPWSALMEANGSHASVYVLNQQSVATLRNVTLAFLDGDNALVSLGLSDGDKVVVKGGPYIIDGAHISVIDEVAQSALQTSAK